ncbi:MAG: hypothetical protein R3F19_12450 [Verrucomicrobiales bacterium]
MIVFSGTFVIISRSGMMMMAHKQVTTEHEDDEEDQCDVVADPERGQQKD